MPVRVSIIIPTQRRPQGLHTAVRSALRQTGVDPRTLELIVVDNDAEPSAQAAVKALARNAPFAVSYVHEPAAGVANARNAGLAAARGEFIAFLDDDEEAPAGWLAALTQAQARFAADVVFGPVRARAPAGTEPHRAYLERFFSREGPRAAGPIDHYYGCGDSLLRRAALIGGEQPFAVERNHTGGEDDLLFARMRAAGARFAWAPDAWVWEDPIPARLNLRYTLRRAFAYGQGPTEACASAEPPDRLGVARWMVIGLGQAGVYGVVALFKWMIAAPDRALALDRAVRGLGKAFWFRPFRIEFYGRAAA